VDSQKILDGFRKASPGNLRLFTFGVGYDVDTFLLDSLSQAHHGASTYVLPGERLNETLSGFYTKISTPVLTDLTLDFGETLVYDLYPDPLPDLFSGSQIILVGRYRQGGVTSIKLNGKVNQETQSFVFPEQEFAARSAARYPLTTIPRLWATRKIGYLLNQIRLKGPDKETIDQIVRLSIRYGIVTPYTSYLVTEEQPLGESEQERIASEQYNQMLVMPPAPVSGQEAVEKAVDQSSLESAQALATPDQETMQQIKVAGARVFVFAGDRWVDTTFDPDKTPTVKVAFLSEEYFALSDSRPELAAAFALGEAVTVVSEGVAYQVVPEGESVQTVIVPPTYTPATTNIPYIPSILSTAVSQNTRVIPASPTTTSLPSHSSACATALSIPILILVVYLAQRSIRR
jgi:Ca-activated chloride channel family protein